MKFDITFFVVADLRVWLFDCSLLLFLGFLHLVFTLLELLFLLVIVEDMEEVIDWAIPLLAGLIDRCLELHRGFLLADIQEKSTLDEADRRLVQFFQTCDQHQDQQVNEDVSVLSDLEEGLTGELLEGFLEVVR